MKWAKNLLEWATWVKTLRNYVSSSEQTLKAGIKICWLLGASWNSRKTSCFRLKRTFRIKRRSKLSLSMIIKSWLVKFKGFSKKFFGWTKSWKENKRNYPRLSLVCPWSNRKSSQLRFWTRRVNLRRCSWSRIVSSCKSKWTNLGLSNLESRISIKTKITICYKK